MTSAIPEEIYKITHSLDSSFKIINLHSRLLRWVFMSIRRMSRMGSKYMTSIDYELFPSIIDLTLLAASVKAGWMVDPVHHIT